jgi:hypothetical protein
MAEAGLAAHTTATRVGQPSQSRDNSRKQCAFHPGIPGTCVDRADHELRTHVGNTRCVRAQCNAMNQNKAPKQLKRDCEEGEE